LAEVAINGTVFMQGGVDGQAVALIPVLRSGNVSWRCIGGPAKAMMGVCRIANSAGSD
jgi:hypothetical protein